MTRPLTVLAVLALTAQVHRSESAEVESRAPELEPQEWLNHKGSISWASLRGRVILVEKWATW